VELNF